MGSRRYPAGWAGAQAACLNGVLRLDELVVDRSAILDLFEGGSNDAATSWRTRRRHPVLRWEGPERDRCPAVPVLANRHITKRGQRKRSDLCVRFSTSDQHTAIGQSVFGPAPSPRIDREPADEPVDADCYEWKPEQCEHEGGRRRSKCPEDRERQPEHVKRNCIRVLRSKHQALARAARPQQPLVCLEHELRGRVRVKRIGHLAADYSGEWPGLAGPNPQPPSR